MYQVRDNRKRNNYRSEYIDGNTARKTKPQKVNRAEARNVKEKNINSRSEGLTMNMGHVAFLAVVSLVCFVMCVTYLSIQSNVASTRDNISGLKKQIKTVQYQNDALSYSINSYVNVDHVYKEATKKLGMRQAKDSQISNYKSSDSGYTLQYGDVPGK